MGVIACWCLWLSLSVHVRLYICIVCALSVHVCVCLHVSAGICECLGVFRIYADVLPVSVFVSVFLYTFGCDDGWLVCPYMFIACLVCAHEFVFVCV